MRYQAALLPDTAGASVGFPTGRRHLITGLGTALSTRKNGALKNCRERG